MNKNTSAFSRKVIKFLTSFTSIVIVSGVSVAVAAITFSNTSITGDSSFNNIVVGTSTASSNLLFIATTSPIFAVSSTGNVGIGTANPSTLLEVVGVVSSTQLRTPSSTISALAFTNASGTNLTASGYLQSAAGNITNVSSTRIDATTGGTIVSVSSTNISASGFGTFPTLNFTNASGTNQTLSGYLSVTGNLRAAAHVNSTGTIPGTPTTCGTTPTVVGTDNAFMVTVGAGASTPACTIPFATAFASKPVCTVTNLNTSTSMFFQASSTASNISINALSSSTPGTVSMSQVQLSVICVGID